METLPLHIEYLLTRHDCVIVPGLGAFIATESEACIDIDNGIVRPCRREISFNSSVVTDDGLLSHSIARREGLAFEEAHRRVASLVEKMRSDLRNEGEVSLGMTGRLIRDSEGLINFQPVKSSLNRDVYSDITLSVAREESSSERSVASELPSASTAQDSEDTEGVRIIRVPADRYVFTIRKRAVHVAAMLITIFTVGLSLLIPINHDNEQKASVISFDEFFRKALKTEVTLSNDSSLKIEIENDTIASEQPCDEI